MGYRPGRKPEPPRDAKATPDGLRELGDYVQRELMSIQKEDNALRLILPMKYLDVAPDKPQDGLYLSAAGVLGASRGLYRYDSSTATYTLIS